MSKTKKRLAVIIVCAVFLLTQAVSLTAFAIESAVKIQMNFANEAPSSAAGTFSVQSPVSGEYELYWGNDNGEKLTLTMNKLNVEFSELATVSVRKGEGSVEINSFTAIPDGAKTVLAYKDGKLAATQDIPEEKTADNGDMTYSFGTLSDLHFNRYNKISEDDAEIAFPNALDFYEDAGVSIVGMPGDLSKNGEESAYQKFNKYTSQYDFSVFTCKGNHDCRSKYKYENWVKYVNTGVYGEEKLPGVIEVAENGLDFVYSDDNITHGDVFIFFSQVNNTYIFPWSRLVTDKQLDWLKAQLEKYKDKTVYLFFHTFLPSPLDTANPFTVMLSMLHMLNGEGNLANILGIYYPLVYTVGTKDQKTFTNLMKEYKNVIFFNGHSHWSYKSQDRNESLNISNNNGTTATLVHISSVTAPRTPSFPLWKSNSGTMSEGTLVAVYENNLVFYGIDFTNKEVLSYATYTVSKAK